MPKCLIQSKSLSVISTPQLLGRPSLLSLEQLLNFFEKFFPPSKNYSAYMWTTLICHPIPVMPAYAHSFAAISKGQIQPFSELQVYNCIHTLVTRLAKLGL